MSSEVFDLIKFFWKHYNGKGFYLYLFLGCMVLLLFLRERRKYNRYLFWYCIGGLILYWIPYTAKIIMDYAIGKTVYWRMFWLLPITFVIAYFAVSCISQLKNRLFAVVLAVLMLSGLAFSGRLVYNKDVFHKSTNYYKLPQTVLGVCDAMKKNADGEEIRAIVPDELISYVRQYDPSIHLIYGRDAGKDSRTDTMEAAIVYDVINNEEQDKETFGKRLLFPAVIILYFQKSIPWTGMRKKNTKKSQKLMSIVFIELTNSKYEMSVSFWVQAFFNPFD